MVPLLFCIAVTKDIVYSHDVYKIPELVYSFGFMFQVGTCSVVQCYSLGQVKYT